MAQFIYRISHNMIRAFVRFFFSLPEKRAWARAGWFGAARLEYVRVQMLCNNTYIAN